MRNGNSNEILDVNNIDEAIKSFILTLNSFEGIETAGSCSGHVQDGKARAYIYFWNTNHINLNKALKFFDNFGFKVTGPDYDSGWYEINIILEKSSGDITEENIKQFWENVKLNFNLKTEKIINKNENTRKI